MPVADPVTRATLCGLSAMVVPISKSVESSREFVSIGDIQASRRGAAQCCRLSPPQTGRADFPHPASPERLLTGHYELAMRLVTFFQRCVVVCSGEFQAAHRSSSVTTFWQGPFAPPA